MKLLIVALAAGWLFSCSTTENRQETAVEETSAELSFTSRQIADDANLWWARTLADLEGDGNVDLMRLTSHDEKDMWLMLNEIR